MESESFTAQDRQRLASLWVAVFGLDGDSGGGLLHEMRELNARIGRLYFAVLTAAISFGFGSVGVVVAVIATQ